MNKSLSAIAITSSLLLFSFTPATLAESECFMRGADGQQIDLSRLCGGSPQKKKPDRQVYQLKIIRRVNGIPTVMVVFNNRHHYEMLFDTGASGIVLTDEMAKTMGVEKEREGIASTAGGVVTIHFARVASVKAGDIDLPNTIVGISPQMEGLGLLGQSFFGSYDVTIKKDVIELRHRQ
jgi:aspartyl protease family protein